MIRAILGLVLIGFLIWPGWAWGRPIWQNFGGPTITTGTTPTTATTTGTTVKVAGSAWTPAQKCAWLRTSFPQTTADVQSLGASLAKVDIKRIRTHSYLCSTTNNDGVFDGFIVLGPNEGFNGEVSMTVPASGAIDAYSTACGAKYSSSPKIVAGGRPNPCDDTWRLDVTGGIVTGSSMTYWPWNDDNAPVSGGATSQSTTPVVSASPVASPVSTQCVQPEQLAKDKGWKNAGWADQKFGGLRVELSSTGTLPDKWEAIASGRSVKENDADRSMVATVWTVYPPYSCREQLGFSK